MISRIWYNGKSGQHLKYSACKQDGTPKGAPLHPLPESQKPGYYTTISHIDLEKGDKVIIYGPENVLWEGEILTDKGDFVTLDEPVGEGGFSAEAQDLASTKQNGEKAKSQIGKFSAKARVLAILVEHPDWSDTKIAKEAGINRTTLYDYPEFKSARKIQKQNKEKFPKGSKDRKCNIEAIDK